MNQTEKLVREFGKQTRIKTEDAAKKLGVFIDRKFLDKRFAVDWFKAILQAEDVDKIIDFYDDVAKQIKGSSRDQMGIEFCLNTCRGGFSQVDGGDYGGALETFGLVRSVQGYLLKNDYRKMFSKLGSNGGKSKNAPMNRVKTRLIELFQQGGNWKNPRQASKKLENKAKEFANEEGTRFTTDDIAGRLYGWFLAANKSSMSDG